MKKITYFIVVLLLLTAVTGCSFSMEDTKEWIDDTKGVNSPKKQLTQTRSLQLRWIHKRLVRK